MNPQGKGVGNIRNNAAFLKFQQAENAEKEVAHPPTSKAEHKASQPQREGRVLFQAAPTKASEDSALSPEHSRTNVARSRSGSRSPTKRLQSRKASSDLPRVNQRLVSELKLEPAQAQKSDEVLQQLSGQAMVLNTDLDALRARVIESPPPAQSARSRRSKQKTEDAQEKRGRSHSPVKRIAQSLFGGKKTGSIASDIGQSPQKAADSLPGSPLTAAQATAVSAQPTTPKQPPKALPRPELPKRPAQPRPTDALQPARPERVQTTLVSPADSPRVQAEPPTSPTTTPGREATSPQTTPRSPLKPMVVHRRLKPREQGEPTSNAAASDPGSSNNPGSNAEV